MNAKQIEIQKEIGRHIAALHSLNEEFERAGDEFDGSGDPLASIFPNTPPDQIEKVLKSHVDALYNKPDNNNPAA